MNNTPDIFDHASGTSSTWQDGLKALCMAVGAFYLIGFTLNFLAFLYMSFVR